MKQVDMSKIAECVADKEVTINGRDYKMLHVPYKHALKVIGFAQRIEQGLIFTGDDQWEVLEGILKKFFSCDGDILAKKEGHFDEYPEDYMTFMAYSVGMVAFPFVKGASTS